MMYSILRESTYWLFRSIVSLFCTPTDVRGLEKLSQLTGPLIVAANHDGRLDPVWISVFIRHANPRYPVDIRFFAWHTFYDMPILGWYIKAMRSYRLINNQGLQVLDPGVDFIRDKAGIIGIFPEGKIRRLTEKDKQAKRGVAYLAWKTEAPVLPIYIKYTRRWKRLPFYRLTFVVGDQFYIHDIIQTEDDLFEAASQVLSHSYSLAPIKHET